MLKAGESPVTDASLLAALALPGNGEAWAEFVPLYGPVIERYARQAGLSAHDADEVRSRVLAALVTAIEGLRYDPTRRFRGYLRTAVNNGVRRLHRERTRRPGDFASGSENERRVLNELVARLDLDGLSDEIEADVHERMQIAQTIVDRVRALVAPKTWQAYWLTAIEEQPAANVAQQLGKSVGAVYMATHRVNKMLKAQVQHFT